MRAGAGRPVSAWVAAMYSKTKATASPLRPAGNAFVTVTVVMPSPRGRR